MKVQDCVFLDIAIDLRMALSIRGSVMKLSYGLAMIRIHIHFITVTLNLCAPVPLNLEMGCLNNGLPFCTMFL